MTTRRLWISATAMLLVSAPSQAQPVAARPAVVLVDQVPAAGGEDADWNRGVPLERRQEARELLLEGNRLFQIPLFSRAADKYRSALTTWGHPAFRFNLALAQLNVGEDLAAHDSLERVIRDGDPLLGKDRIDEARKQLQEVERRLGRIRIRCSTPGAIVTMDGTTLFKGPGHYEGWVEPRNHEIVARKSGFVPEARHVKAAGGKLEDVTVTLVPLDVASDAGRRWAQWKPWAVIAAGALLTAASASLHAISARGFENYDAAFLQLPCKDAGCKTDEIGADLTAQLDRARLQQRIAVGGYALAGATLAAGAALVYFNRPRLKEQDGASLTPVVSADALGVLVTVSH